MADVTCLHDGCARRVYARGRCKHHYDRDRRSGAMPVLLVHGNDEERFWAKVQKTETCWLWTASLNRSGYGKFHASGRFAFAHRWSYEHFIRQIPDGLVIDHLCRVPACVNPDHLEPVTHQENILRGTAPSAKLAMATHCIHGHEFTPENTYIRPNGNRSCRTCLRSRSMQWNRERGVRPANPIPTKVCPTCGAIFKPIARHVVCCSRSCGQKMRFTTNTDAPHGD